MDLNECLLYPTNQNLNRICQLLVDSKQDNLLIQKIIESRRLNSLYGQISIRKRFLLKEIQLVYDEIKNLQNKVNQLHQNILLHDESINMLFPHLSSGWQDKYLANENETSQETDQSTEDQSEESTNQQNSHSNQQSSQPNQQNNKLKKHRKIRRKRDHQTAYQKAHYHLKKQSNKWVRSYANLDYDHLKPIKELNGNPYCKSIKLMENQVIRKKYDLNQAEHKKAFHREIAIFKYLSQCRFVPPLLSYNLEKGTLFIPYPTNNDNRSTNQSQNQPKNQPNQQPEDNLIILRTLKNILANDWNVKLSPPIDEKEQLDWLIINDKRAFLIDFSHPNWKVGE